VDRGADAAHRRRRQALEAFAGVTAAAPVPSDPSAVAARITHEVSRELGAVLER
jgi:F420-0:gamma-glutamyl ligase-like protein